MTGSAFFGHAIPVSSLSNRESFFHNPSKDSMLVSCTGSEVCNDCVLDGDLGRLTNDKTLEGNGIPVRGQGQKSSIGVEGIDSSKNLRE